MRGVWDSRLLARWRSCNLLLRRHLVLSPVYNIIKVPPSGGPAAWLIIQRQEALADRVCKPCDDLRERLCIGRCSLEKVEAGWRQLSEGGGADHTDKVR